MRADTGVLETERLILMYSRYRYLNHARMACAQLDRARVYAN